MNIKEILISQKDSGIRDNLYKYTLISLTYHTNKLEGSTVTLEQTNDIYEFGRVTAGGNPKVDDIIETQNSFRMFDYMLDTVSEPLSEELIKEYHKILKSRTNDSILPWFAVGDYKRVENMVGMLLTTPPEEVEDRMYELLVTYAAKDTHSIEDIIQFHSRFETIHPFQDGNGRVGRLIMFRECLKNDVEPFIITNEKKIDYVMALREYNNSSEPFLDLVKELQREYAEKAAQFTKVYEKNMIR